jgi:hypothetical protein
LCEEEESDSIDSTEINLPNEPLDSNHYFNEKDETHLNTHALFEENIFSDLELNSIFLAMFYNTNITQTGFCDIMKTMKMITNMELPTSFNSCAKKLLNTFGDKIEYSKQWYCVTCKIFVDLSNQYMRNCKTCLKKYLNIL